MASAHKVHLRIVTADAQVVDEEADMVIAPGGAGVLGIQARHIPLVTTLKPGELRIFHDDDEEIYAVAGGFLEVRNEDEGSAIIVLANAAENAAGIDIARAEAARARAEALLSQSQSNVDAAGAQAALLRAMTRLRVAEQYRTRRSGRRQAEEQ
jgi:F-type H+-transporting ATPase subunit epsilon